MPKFDVTVKGMALEDEGLSDQNTVDGFALMTQGFIWGCGNIWDAYTTLNGVAPVTTWANYLTNGTPVNTWSYYSSTGSTITTIWIDYSTQGIEDC